jgi:hypothetical protein
MDVVIRKMFSVRLISAGGEFQAFSTRFPSKAVVRIPVIIEVFFNMELSYCRAEAIIGLYVAINICCTVESRTRRRRAGDVIGRYASMQL